MWCGRQAFSGGAHAAGVQSKVHARLCSKGEAVTVTALVPEGFLYCPYMVKFNIPMYWRIFRHDEEQGKTYMSILEGIVDSARTCLTADIVRLFAS